MSTTPAALPPLPPMPWGDDFEAWLEVHDSDDLASVLRAYAQQALSSAARESGEAPPIDMVLHCPACGKQHIDAPEVEGDEARRRWHSGKPMGWTNPPHRSHLCHGCGHIWRPADVPTNGVAAVKTRGKNDSPIAARADWPAGLLDRVKAAEQRIRDNHAPRRIPADPTDIDLVLAEVRMLLEGKSPPSWLAPKNV